MKTKKELTKEITRLQTEAKALQEQLVKVEKKEFETMSKKHLGRCYQTGDKDAPVYFKCMTSVQGILSVVAVRNSGMQIMNFESYFKDDYKKEITEVVYLEEFNKKIKELS